MCFTIHIERSMKDRELKMMVFTNNGKEMCFLQYIQTIMRESDFLQIMQEREVFVQYI